MMPESTMHETQENLSAQDVVLTPNAMVVSSKPEKHRVVVALLATVVAAGIGSTLGSVIGGWGDKKDKTIAKNVFGIGLGIASGMLALEANLREPKPVSSVAEEAALRKKIRNELASLNPSIVRPPTITSDQRELEGRMQPPMPELEPQR